MIAEQDREYFQAPTGCPACQGSVSMVGEYLSCLNEDCPGQVIGMLMRWVGKVNILNFGEALMVTLIESGLVTKIPDLYRLQEGQVASLDMGGRRVGGMAARALKGVQDRKKLPLELIVGSVGIPLVGRKMARLLIEAGFDTLDKMKAASGAKLAAIPSFGITKAESFLTGFRLKEALLREILTVVEVEEPKQVEVLSAKLAGKAVCMTGFRDAAMEEAVRQNGGTVASGVSKNTHILVCKDKSSGSGKAQKARELGLQLYEPDEFWQLLRGV